MPDNGDMKLGVEGLGQFTRDLRAASDAVKNLGSASKLADSELRKTGDTSTYVQQKSAALTRQIEAQERAVEAAAAGLREAAAAYGENSKKAQEWQAKLNNAQAGLNNLQANLAQVQNGTDKVSASFRGASKSASEHNSLVKNINYQTFMQAVDRVEGKLKSMGAAAKRVGQQIWQSARESSDWADSLITDATKYGISTKTLQQWQYAANFVDTEASTIAQAMNKTRSGMTGASKAAAEALNQLGVSARGSGSTMEDVQATFWDAVDALGRMHDEIARDDLAQQLFGKSFADLKPLIDAGRDSWEAYCNEAERAGLVLSDDQVGRLGEFNDSLMRMDASFAALKNGGMAALAPGLKTISDSLGDATQKLMAWANSTEGQESLGKLSDSISDIVTTIADTDMTGAINGITDAIRGIGDAAAWAAENAAPLWTIVKGLGGIIVGGKVLSIGAKGVQTVQAIGRTLGFGSAAAGTAGAAGGTAASGGIMAAVKAIPAAVGKGVTTALTSTAGVGTLGFTGGMAAVLGVGMIAKAMDNAQISDFGMGKDRSAYTALVERNRLREESAQTRRQNTLMSEIRGTTDAITQAIADVKSEYATDWRTREQREKISSLTPDDITRAIDAASIGFTNAETGGEGQQTQIQIDVGVTAEAVRVALEDGQVTEHEIKAIQKYIDEHFTPAVEEAVKLIDGGWEEVEAAMNNPPSARKGNASAPETEVEVLEFSAMSLWVETVMGGEEGDKARAVAKATELWQALIAEVGTPGSVIEDLSQTAEEAKASGENQTWNAMVSWVETTLGLDKEAAEAEAATLWAEMQAAVSKPSGATGAPQTEEEQQQAAFTAMTDWVSANVGGDEANAEEEARKLWIALIEHVGSPDNFQEDLKQSATEAKASGTNKTWNFMVNWVQTTLGLDESAAEQKVSQLWQQLGQYATAADRYPQLNNAYKPGGTPSTVFQDYADALFEGDYEAAMAKINAWLEDIDKAVERHNANPTGKIVNPEDGSAPGINGSSYLTDKVAELATVRDQIQELVDYIAEHAGETIDQTVLDRLDELMTRAERLSDDVSWYKSDEAVQGRGAMGLAMQGIDIENTMPLAIAYAKALREHEIAGIDQDIENAKLKVGTTFADWMQAQGALQDLKTAGITSGEEYDEAQANLAKAEAAYQKAQADYETAQSTEEVRKAEVEREYQENVIEITAGALKAAGYEGGGKGEYVAVTAEQQKAANEKRDAAVQEHYTPSMVAEMSGAAMGGMARAYAIDTKTEAGQQLYERQMAMSAEQRQMASALYARYGSYENFMASLPANQRSAMKGILNYTQGTGAEGNFWSDVMFSAFGRNPDNMYYNHGGQGSLSSADQSAAWSFISQLIDFTPKQSDEQAKQKEAEAQAAAINEALEQLVAAYDEESGYNSARDIVKNLADTGLFAGFDWSQFEGGMVEDILADLAAEAEATGKDVGEGYGTGMESSAQRVFTAGEAMGKQGTEGVAEGAETHSPSRATMQTGQQLAEGLALGIESGGGMVAEAARILARQAIDAMRQELDIHSPSKVMEGLGEFTTEGFAAGIEDSVGSVTNAMDTVVDAVRRPVEGYAGAGSSGGSSISSNSAIYIDNYNQNSAEDVAYLRDELAGMSKRELQGYGLRR